MNATEVLHTLVADIGKRSKRWVMATGKPQTVQIAALADDDIPGLQLLTADRTCRSMRKRPMLTDSMGRVWRIRAE